MPHPRYPCREPFRLITRRIRQEELSTVGKAMSGGNQERHFRDFSGTPYWPVPVRCRGPLDEVRDKVRDKVSFGVCPQRAGS